jgi:serine/threonine protein kinase
MKVFYNAQKSDIWSLGVLIYLGLSGTLPFDDEKDNYQFDGSESTDLSEVGLCSINSCELLFNIIICLICYLEL